jgi:PAS domain S-box-containing protein
MAPLQLGTFDLNHRTGTRHWSPEMKLLFGLKPESEVGFDAIFHALHPDDRRAWIGAITDTLRPDGPDHFSMEYRVRWPDGSVHWLFSMARTQHSDEPDHRPLSTIGLVTDITRQKQAERIEEMTMG